LTVPLGPCSEGVSRVTETPASRRKDRRVKILVAEPTPDPTLASPERWERRGFEPVVAQDAIEALRHFRDDAPGLVVLDDRLPGFELSGLVRILHSTAGQSTIPVLLLTHSKDGAAAALAVGADGFIRAPDAKGRLPEAIDDAFAMTRGHRK
jgi:DNA-binding response OmpR family regulator